MNKTNNISHVVRQSTGPAKLRGHDTIVNVKHGGPKMKYKKSMKQKIKSFVIGFFVNYLTVAAIAFSLIIVATMVHLKTGNTAATVVLSISTGLLVSILVIAKTLLFISGFFIKEDRAKKKVIGSAMIAASVLITYALFWKFGADLLISRIPEDIQAVLTGIKPEGLDNPDLLIKLDFRIQDIIDAVFPAAVSLALLLGVLSYQTYSRNMKIRLLSIVVIIASSFFMYTLTAKVFIIDSLEFDLGNIGDYFADVFGPIADIIKNPDSSIDEIAKAETDLLALINERIVVPFDHSVDQAIKLSNWLFMGTSFSAWFIMILMHINDRRRP